jgi:hypothetical protein
LLCEQTYITKGKRPSPNILVQQLLHTEKPLCLIYNPSFGKPYLSKS